MISRERSAAWPYLGVLLILFVLCVSAPRAWERMSGKSTLDGLLAERRAGATTNDDECAVSEATTEDAGPWRSIVRDSAPEQSADNSPPLAPASPADPEFDFPEAAAPTQSLTGGDVSTPLQQPSLPVLARQVVDIALELARRPIRLPIQTPQEPTPELQPEPTAEVAEPERAWPAAASLQQQLTRLAERPDCVNWCAEIGALLEELSQQPTIESPRAQEILVSLRSAANQGSTLALRIQDRTASAELDRVQYALRRRLDVWERVVRLSQPGPVNPAPEPRDNMAKQARERNVAFKIKARVHNEKLAQSLDDVEHLMQAGARGAEWRKYLMLDELRRLQQTDEQQMVDQKRMVSQAVLDRLSKTRLSKPQRQFVADPQIAALERELRHWASEPVDVSELLGALERYEITKAPSDGRVLAQQCRSLNWTDQEAAVELSKNMEGHYRNANVRLAVAGSLMNRMTPQPKTVESQVNDQILGAFVSGQSTTFAKLFVRLIPDTKQLRLGLEASGTVASDTASTSGPATFYNLGESSFLVRKLFVMNGRGLRVWPAIAEADAYYSNLVGFDTDYDEVPVLRSLVRNIARSQHEDAQREARGEVEQRVADRARSQLDTEIAPRLVQAEQKFREKVLQPLDRLQLEPTALDLSTTEDRMIMRFRLAGADQVAAHTPRPRAPSDSVMSLQLHQSAMNNALENLDLDGRQFTLPELYAWLSQRLGYTLTVPEDVPDDVSLKFAERDALRVSCDEGRIEVTFSLAEFKQGRNRWRDFAARTYFRPDPIALQVSFMRDSSVFLEGESLRGKPQILLRTIFSKIFPKQRHWNLAEPKLATDPRFADLEITQFAIEDGWIGLAYSVQRTPSATTKRKPVSILR